MNCYYSNLIEGHDTHPVDIERALNKDYSGDPQKRNLQLEAEAHIAVQKWIDESGLAGRATTVAAILGIHQRFCEHLPDALLWVEHPTTKEKLPVVPGQTRAHEVEVGRHVPVSPGAVPRFLARFEEPTARSASRRRSLPPPPRITGLRGYTRSLAAMAVSCGSCSMPPCCTRSIPAACGLSRAARNVET